MDIQYFNFKINPPLQIFLVLLNGLLLKCPIKRSEVDNPPIWHNLLHVKSFRTQPFLKANHPETLPPPGSYRKRGPAGCQKPAGRSASSRSSSFCRTENKLPLWKCLYVHTSPTPIFMYAEITGCWKLRNITKKSPVCVCVCGFTWVRSHVQQKAVMGRGVQGQTRGPVEVERRRFCLGGEMSHGDAPRVLFCPPRDSHGSGGRQMRITNENDPLPGGVDGFYTLGLVLTSWQ